MTFSEEQGIRQELASLKKNQSNSKGGGAGVIVVVILCAVIYFAFAFGLNLVFLIIREFHFHFDRGQFWSLAVLVSLAVFFIIKLIYKKWKKVFSYYFLLNLIVVGSDLLSFFLFKLPFLKLLAFTAFGFRW